MRPETMNNLISQDFFQSPPIKLQLTETWTIQKLKERVEKEHNIPTEFQHWIVGKTLDDDDEVKMEAENLGGNKSVFLVLSAPVMEVCGEDGTVEASEIVKDTAGKMEEISNAAEKKKKVIRKRNNAAKVKVNIHPDVDDKIDKKYGEEKIEKKLTAKEKRKLWIAEKIKQHNREKFMQKQNENKTMNFPKPTRRRRQKRKTLAENSEKLSDNNEINNHVMKKAAKKRPKKIAKKPATDITEQKEIVQEDESMVVDEAEPHDKDQEKIAVLDEEKNAATSETMELVSSTEEESINLPSCSKTPDKPHEENTVPLVKNPQISSLPSLADIPLTNNSTFMAFTGLPAANIQRKPLAKKTQSMTLPKPTSWSDEDGAVGFDNPWACEQPHSSSMYEEKEETFLQQRRKLRNQMNIQHEDLLENVFFPLLDYSNHQAELNEEREVELAMIISKEEDKKINNNCPVVESKVYVNKNLENGEKNGFTELMMLEEMDLVPNTYEFKCTICLEFIGSNQGISLHGCLHTFCRICLRDTIRHCEEPEVKCPFTDDNSCESKLLDREIKALVDVETYEKHIERSLICAEKSAGTFHCLSPDCIGWCYYSGFGLEFFCEVCCKVNCLVCRVIHVNGQNCADYQEELEMAVDKDKNTKLTEKQMQEMIAKREVLVCTCGASIVKNGGCDAVDCIVCKARMCWPTRGPRWGPKGQGDTSGGCQCGIPSGRLCHPECTGCH